MFTKDGNTSEITIQGEGCHLTVLLVGGGGRGGDRGGGGSGYLEYHSLQVSAGTKMTTNVGSGGQSSSLTISGKDTITAQPGEDSQGWNGGNGYSGGGGGRESSSRGGDGGSNGGDGERGSWRGGTGTGQDVSLFTFTTWSLGPGAGGQGDGYYGGGGGGVMVNGAGPQINGYQVEGAGYGGGGNGYANGGVALPGVILVEIQ